ncbi:39S ribosomal protein L36, mitochondrial [Bombyx mandarina]|uniref:Ribosomal protein n=1 Tax=Bombyx mandarina TaxID=7092 RepID=A0A6J2JKD0_BOMMA|nr:39S ribosomal protein L36, mitochondrial [Bombyx mandarina]
MQKLFSLVKVANSLIGGNVLPILNRISQPSVTNFVKPVIPLVTQISGIKIKGRVRRRCRSCYFVFRDERVYIMCSKFPRHKQMSMKPKPHNTWILTQASQSPVRPW